MTTAGWPRRLLRGAGLVGVAALAFELAFVVRVLCLAAIDPLSTPFQRSELVRLASERQPIDWRQRWTPAERIAPALKRAVIASEDAGFTTHGGVEWSTIDRAWQKNLEAERRAERQAERLAARPAAMRRPDGAAAKPVPSAKLVGGSTITQQLAKNLFLSGERTWPRKAQEIVLAYLLEAVLGKRRILELYLNEVEWGTGVFGAEAAAERYFRSSAATLAPAQAARLAVLLPAPKLYERRPDSPYLRGRAATVAARMGAAALP